MKNVTFRTNHSKKEKTLNYPQDSDKQFCRRCYLINNICQQPKGCPFDHRKEKFNK